jgi:hypothetical protein
MALALPLLATGMCPWEALLALNRSGVGLEVLMEVPDLAATTLRERDPGRTMAALDELAKVNPGEAGDALNLWLRHDGVGGDLDVSERAWVQPFPEGLRVRGHLDAWGYPHEVLPAGLRVKGYLRLGKSRVTTLPADLRVGGDLSLQDSQLQRLPDGFGAQGDLDLNHCEHLEALPRGLAVGGGLVLDGCIKLVALPRGLQVGTWLGLDDCPAWDGIIPDDAVVGREVFTGGSHTGLLLEEWRQRHPRGERPQT